MSGDVTRAVRDPLYSPKMTTMYSENLRGFYLHPVFWFDQLMYWRKYFARPGAPRPPGPARPAGRPAGRPAAR